ncbi:Hamartin protein-domain-containing protein [Lipomyces chichibuensis]|uniref:Hamartin protein-domain-containing protein n=1 Tax=Lipomyces chichibuensis TaxID=1546026 RepID=UPI0033433721
MSGSLRDLSKAVTAALSSADPPLARDQRVELPDTLSGSLTAYINKHDKYEASDAQKLHEELVNACRTYVVSPNSPQESLFLQIILQLIPNVTAHQDGVKFWIDQFVLPAIDSAGRSRAIVEDARAFLFNIMVYDADDESIDLQLRDKLSDFVADMLVRIYVGTKQLVGVTGTSMTEYAGDDVAERQVICIQNAESELRRFGNRRPKAFFNVLDQYFVKKEYRVAILSLLCSFMQAQPPHLFETHSSKLVGHLYKCLLHDRSAVAVNLACTVFVMLLPHICSILGPDLPKIFAVYARMMYWDILYKKEFAAPGDAVEEDGRAHNGPDDLGSSKSSDDASSPSSTMSYGGYYYYDDTEGKDPGQGSLLTVIRPQGEQQTWDILDGSFDDPAGAGPDSLTVNYSRIFTFIYGLYPIHFLTFLTSPRRYFRMRNAEISDYIKYDIDDIALRSQVMSRRHLLHPNFFRYTFESEISDRQRWDLAGTAEDVAAFCITLDTKNLEMPEMQEPTVIFRGFHDHPEHSTEDPLPAFMSLDESAETDVEIVPSDERPTDSGTSEVQDAMHRDEAFSVIDALDEIPEDSYLFPTEDNIGRASDRASIGIGSDGHSTGGRISAPIIEPFMVKGLQSTSSESERSKVVASPNFKPQTPIAASVSSISGSGEMSPGGNTHRPIMDIESILEDHRDINSLVMSRRGSVETASLGMSSPVYRSQQHGSLSESISSLKLPAPITNINSNIGPDIEHTTSSEEGQRHASVASSIKSLPLSPKTQSSPGLSRQNPKSPMSFMQLSHAHFLGSSSISANTVSNAAPSQDLRSMVQVPVPYLQRQLLVLRNELNFERYLKQLRLRNLRRLKEQYSILQRDDANTQGLLLSNRMLQTKIERLQTDAKKQHATLTTLATDRAKYSNQLLQKNRDLKAERDQWKAEEDGVRGALEASRMEVEMLKQGFLEKEAEIERVGRRLKDAMTTASEVESLRKKYTVLQSRVLEMYARDERKSKAPLTDENEELQNRIAKLELRVKLAESESQQLEKQYLSRVEELEQELTEIKSRIQTGQKSEVL